MNQVNLPLSSNPTFIFPPVKKEGTSMHKQVTLKAITTLLSPQTETTTTSKVFEDSLQGSPKPRLQRKISAPELRNLAAIHLLKEKNMRDKECKGNLWVCTAQKPDRKGGYIYHFSLDPSIESKKELEERYWKMFPGIQPRENYFEILKLDETSPTSNKEKREVFHELGYSSYVDENSKRILALPDLESLTARLERLKKKDSRFSNVRVGAADGVSNNMEYVEAHILYDGMLSSNAEFIHDHIYHIIKLIRRVLLFSTSEEYQTFRSKFTFDALARTRNKILLCQKIIDWRKSKKLSAEVPEECFQVVKTHERFRTAKPAPTEEQDFLKLASIALQEPVLEKLETMLGIITDQYAFETTYFKENYSLYKNPTSLSRHNAFYYWLSSASGWSGYWAKRYKLNIEEDMGEYWTYYSLGMPVRWKYFCDLKPAKELMEILETWKKN